MAPADPLPALLPRPFDANKASVGRVLVVGGSLGMAGAPALAARGALRAGAGLVTIAVPARVQDVVAGFQPEAMTIGLPCDDAGALRPEAVEALRPALRRADAIVVGPGLSRAPGALEAVRRLLAACPAAAVVDADGLFAYRQAPDALAPRRATTVLTPHEGEAAALLGERRPGDAGDRTMRAERIARLARAVCVLKGPGTLVTDGRRTHVNPTGGPVLATGGSGDVLSGVIAAFLAGLPATGGDALGAARLAVLVHGRAGDLLARRRGDRGVLAGEIADALPEAILATAETGR